MKLSTLAETLVGSEIVKLGNAISDRIRQGEKIYNFTIGDFDPNIFPIPQQLEDGIQEAYQHHYTNYPPADGILELRQAVGGFLKRELQLDYAPNELLIAAGGRPLIYTIFKVIVDEGDKVIYAAPSWNNMHYTHMNKGVHVKLQALPSNNFMPTAAQIAPHVAGASLISLCTPQNPTGTTMSRDELEKICDLILAENNRRSSDAKKLYLLFDQMYWTLTFNDTVHYNPVSLRPEMKEYTIFVDGISKALAATGLRLGWSAGPASVIAKMKAILSHIGAWSPMAEQHATARFLADPDAVNGFLVPFKKAIEQRLRAIYDGFQQLKQAGFAVDAVSPQAAIYLTVKVDLAGKTTAAGVQLSHQDDVTAYLLSEAKLAMVPFHIFGAEKSSPWYRLSVGTCREEDISEMLGKLRLALEQLR